MEVALVPVLVALIGGPLMWYLARFDKRNTDQHGSNMRVLQRIERKLDIVDERLYDHIDGHPTSNEGTCQPKKPQTNKQ